MCGTKCLLSSRDLLRTVAWQGPQRSCDTVEPAKPAVSPKKSITPDYLICLEDGNKFKSLKRHLRTMYNMSPEQYREKWGLASDIPDGRTQLCRSAVAPGQGDGLGQKRKRAARR